MAGVARSGIAYGGFSGVVDRRTTYELRVRRVGIMGDRREFIFVAHYFAMPSRALLVLPAGASAIMLSMFAFADQLRPSQVVVDTEAGSLSALLIAHIVGVACSFAALLLAGTGAAGYLLAQRKLKTSLSAALKLPKLPDLEIISERGLVISAALLLGASAMGGVLIFSGDDKSLSPTAIIGIVTLVLMSSLVVLRGAVT